MVSDKHAGCDQEPPFLEWGTSAYHCHPASQHYRIGRMPDPVDPKAFLTLVELAIGNMYEVEAIGELLEQKGVMTKNEIIALAKELKRKNPPTEPPTSSTTDPSLQRFTETDNAVIEELMAVILQHGLTADQAKTLLGRTIQLLEWGKRPANQSPQANA